MTTSVPIPLKAEPTPRWWPWLRLLLFLPLLALPLLLLAPPLLKVPAYEVRGGTITARSAAGRTVIPAGTPVTAAPVRLVRREMGTSTKGYVVGRFRTEGGQSVNVYSDGSHASGALTFATQPRPTVLTPADPDALLAAWRSGETATLRPPTAPGYDLGLLLALLPVVPLTLFLFSNPRVRYLRDGNTLVVRTAYSVTRLPRSDSSATLTRDPLGVRMFGTAIPGYYTGTFGQKGGTVQAAASVSRPAEAVLVTHAGRRYYLTPQDPQALAGWFGRRS